MEIRVNIPDDFVSALKAKLQTDSTKELVEQAFAVLDWASSEAGRGRIVASAEPNGDQVRQLVTPALNRIASTNSARVAAAVAAVAQNVSSMPASASLRSL